MIHGLTVPIKWPKLKLEGTVLSPVDGLLIYSPSPSTRYVQEAAFLCCRSGREVGIQLDELLSYAADEDLTRDYLEQLRWPDGVACPRCGSLEIRDVVTRNQYDCVDCKHRFSLTSDTALHGTRISLRKWLFAVYQICMDKKGVSSIQLGKMLGIQQRSAWYMEHRIRNAVRQTVEPIQNAVEVDETWIGGVGNKTMVVGLIERGGKVVLQVKEDRTKATLHEFILDHVDGEYPIYTDDWRGYWGLPNHNTVTHSAFEYSKEDGEVHTNTIEGFWSLVKKAVRGTFHHVSAKHLPLYLDELAWRYNNRDRDMMEQTLLRLLRADHIQYRELTA